MKKVKKIGVFSFGRLQALIGGLIGLILGVIYSFGGLLVDTLVTLDWITTSETPGLSYGTVLAFGALVAMPALGSIAGFLLGMLEAILYNLFAKWTGGLSIDLEY